MVKKKDKEIKIFCDMTRCVACKSCEIACGVEHSKEKDLNKAAAKSTGAKKRVRVSATPEKVISIHCQHCDDAPCVDACMSGAMTKDKSTGATVQDKDKCVGCWMCVMSCPFGAIARDTNENIAVKCDLCPDRDDYACVAVCPTKALFVGTEEEFKKMLKERANKAKAKKS